MRLAELILVFLTAAACRAAAVSPYTLSDEGRPSLTERDAERAMELNRRAADLLTTDLDEAERLLRAALAADLYCGPAHNNLGIVHLSRGQLYEAAHEFEWARKLLPGHPDPRLNLAIALHRGGRVSDSAEAYEAALEVAPGHLDAIQGLARLTLEHGLADGRLPGWLRRIVLEGSPEWRQWAKKELALGTSR